MGTSRGAPPAEAVGEAPFAGRYALLGKIGRGGMGTVYRARDTLVGDVVALKVLEVGAGGELLERFRREVRLARRISHPHVARTHDLGEHQGRLFLTMEYVEGEDLQALLRREQPLAAARAARIALAVCEGLAAAHAAGVVHRDLKPANVLVEAGGRVVLTDFGIARAAAEDAAGRTQDMVGTPLYMAPEQIEGGEVGARADLYAAGLLLYEMLTGKPPFAGESPMAVAFARLRRPPPDPSGHPGVPEALAALVRSCVARAVEERPAGAMEVATALRDWLVSVNEPVDLPVAHATPVPGARVTGTATGTSSTGGGAFATGSSPSLTGRTTPRPGEQSLAVLPLRFMGPREQEYLGDGLTEVLIDVLSRTQGVRVHSSGATARFRTERDPRGVGRELGVGFVVDGTVQSTGTVVRVSLRLVEGASGIQLWSGRFEEAGEDPFALQDRLGHRMVEALRTELLIFAYQDQATPEAVALYRHAMKQSQTTSRIVPEQVLKPLEDCIAQSPAFLPALATHAVVTVRTWFVRSGDTQHDWQALARASLERAVQQAPELMETHLAKALMATQDGDWRAAVLAARTALDAAPTFALALQFLGSLQCEAGRADEGIPRLELAYALEPGLAVCLNELARCSALRGQTEAYQGYMARMVTHPFLRVPALLLRMRVAAWTRDLEELGRVQAELRGEPNLVPVNADHYSGAVLGELKPLEVLALFDAMLARRLSPRFASLVCQLVTEMLGVTGHAERAMEYFERAADTALIDLEWVDRCPALASLRALPRFQEVRLKVRRRVEAIWMA